MSREICTGSSWEGGLGGRAVAASAEVKNIKDNDDRLAYLSGLGWQTSSQPIATEELLIPEDAPCRASEAKVDECSPVLVDGAAIPAHVPVYLMLHKPAGGVSSTEEPPSSALPDGISPPAG